MFQAELVCGDCAQLMPTLPGGSVHLIVTSPPYGNMYSGLTIDRCRELIQAVVRESARVLSPGGKLAINVNNYVTSKKNGHAQRHIVPMTRWIQDVCALLYQDEIFWIKNLAQASRPRPLFGSYPYPPNFLMAQRVEYVQVWAKPGKRLVAKELKRRSALTKEEWREWTQNAWNIQGARSKVHDAPFPEELARRLVRLYSFVGDVVLDPFFGTGTTAVVCQELERRFIGYEINAQYVARAQSRVRQLSQA